MEIEQGEGGEGGGGGIKMAKFERTYFMDDPLYLCLPPTAKETACCSKLRCPVRIVPFYS